MSYRPKIEKTENGLTAFCDCKCPYYEKISYDGESLPIVCSLLPQGECRTDTGKRICEPWTLNRANYKPWAMRLDQATGYEKKQDVFDTIARKYGEIIIEREQLRKRRSEAIHSGLVYREENFLLSDIINEITGILTVEFECPGCYDDVYNIENCEFCPKLNGGEVDRPKEEKCWTDFLREKVSKAEGTVEEKEEKKKVLKYKFEEIREKIIEELNKPLFNDNNIGNSNELKATFLIGKNFEIIIMSIDKTSKEIVDMIFENEVYETIAKAKLNE